MSDGYNRVMLLGALGADPELRMTQGGQAVLNMRLATNESYFDKKKNERQERTDWHSVVVWGARAEALAKILTKGSSIFVEGSLRTSSYEKDGEKRYRTEVNATNIILAGSRPQGSGSTSRGYGGGSARAPNPDAAPPDVPQDDGFGGDDSDIPFIRRARGMRP